MFKKIVFLVLIAGLTLASCAPKTVILPQNDPNSGTGATSPDGVPAGIKCQNSQPVLDELGFETDEVICNGHTAADLSGASGIEVSALAALALSDGPVSPVMDAVAITYVAGRVAIVWLTATAAAAIAKKTGVVALAHSDPSHNIKVVGTTGYIMASQLLAYWTATATTGGPDPNRVKCGLIKAADGVVRAVIWLADEANPAKGFLAWFDVKANEWVGAYRIDLKGFQKGPRVSDRGWTWESNNSTCNNLPPLPPLATQ